MVEERGSDRDGNADREGHTDQSPSDRHIERTFELAREAVADGNTPFGSLLVVDGEVVRESRNTTRSDDDVTAHPELKLARWAASELDDDELDRCTMYTSTEPCPMCASAIVYAGLDRVVFAVRGRTLATLSDGVIDIPCEEVVRRANGDTTVEGPVNEAAGMRVHETFFG